MTNSPSRRFDARRATGRLLLLTGSLVGGLTVYWLTPRAAASSQSVASTSADAAQDQWAAGNGDFGGNGWTAPDSPYPPGDQQDFRPSFSGQPSQAPQGWTRGS
ncbi:hypothetical protein [Deinococcus apachensis]|uniref:hypothetical protein n=1 Tax=Deinococcus apachensis TaxID=309886 RepID=UPI00036FC380|nr:hypothetical protein [Deinococcus apachensis]